MNPLVASEAKVLRPLPISSWLLQRSSVAHISRAPRGQNMRTVVDQSD
jgi:hypothetical protein